MLVGLELSHDWMVLESVVHLEFQVVLVGNHGWLHALSHAYSYQNLCPFLCNHFSSVSLKDSPS